MIVGSLFAGVGGFDLGLERAGHDSVWQVELDPKCRQVLERHFPNARRHEDVREVGRANLDSVDLICGGFPCQDLSMAGRRAGLAGDRSGLWFEFHRVLAELQPRWCVIENVPGLLSSHGGKDFAVLLEGLAQLGYCVSWRVLDAQHFGLAQRRKRVFIVGSLGNGRCAEVLFEPSSLRGDPPPRREARPDSAAPPISRALSRVGGGDDPGANKGAALIAHTLKSENGRQYGTGPETNFVATGLRAADGHHGRSSPRGDGSDNLIPFNIVGGAQHSKSHAHQTSISGALQHKGNTASGNEAGTVVRAAVGVRRLTPRECERLQGFPDDWTAGHADSHRYRMMGNAVAVPVAEWIGRRLPANESGPA